MPRSVHNLIIVYKLCLLVQCTPLIVLILRQSQKKCPEKRAWYTYRDLEVLIFRWFTIGGKNELPVSVNDTNTTVILTLILMPILIH